MGQVASAPHPECHVMGPKHLGEQLEVLEACSVCEQAELLEFYQSVLDVLVTDTRKSSGTECYLKSVSAPFGCSVSFPTTQTHGHVTRWNTESNQKLKIGIHPKKSECFNVSYRLRVL